ncbi:MAG: hypothetical protein CMJ46_02010 [Planctomyces sp.]|nr:hypothetical protein [Planctomyces sp.]
MSKLKIIGWILSGLLAAMLIGISASGKLFYDFEGKEKMFAKLGWEADVMFYVGILEVTATILYLIPRTAVLGGLLLIGYLGGAVATHLRIEDPISSTLTPVIVGIVAWIALGLRDRRVFRFVFQSPDTPIRIHED